MPPGRFRPKELLHLHVILRGLRFQLQYLLPRGLLRILVVRVVPERTLFNRRSDCMYKLPRGPVWQHHGSSVVFLHRNLWRRDVFDGCCYQLLQLPRGPVHLKRRAYFLVTVHRLYCRALRAGLRPHGEFSVQCMCHWSLLGHCRLLGVKQLRGLLIRPLRGHGRFELLHMPVGPGARHSPPPLQTFFHCHSEVLSLVPRNFLFNPQHS